MATARPFAVNTGTTVTGTTQIGDLGVGVDPIRYDLHPGDITWYMGADEELGYIIGRPNLLTDKPRFLRSPTHTDDGFVAIVNYVDKQEGGSGTFTNAYDAKQWLDGEEYWTTFTGGTEPPEIFFEKTDYGSEVDKITDNVWFTRGDNRGIYNTVQEIEFNTDYYTMSPRDVIWNSEYIDKYDFGFDDLSDIIERKYGSFWEACDSAFNDVIVGLELIAYLIPDDKYYKFLFSGWTANDAGGGFSYTRTEIVKPSSTWTAFTKPNSGNTSTYKDEISPYLHITRGNSQGIYNSVYESGWNEDTWLSPTGSSWNSVYTDAVYNGWGDLSESNITGRTYGDWNMSTDYFPPDGVDSGIETILYDDLDDKYYQYKATQWSQGINGSPAANGGGFRYIRKEISFIPPTPTPTPTVSPSSVTPTPTPTVSPSSVTPTPTPTVSPSISVTPTVTPSVTISVSVTPSVTVSVSVTPSVTPSTSPILEITPSNWFLPSTDEWDKIDDLYSYGVFNTGQTYWTSTENDSASVSGTSINGSGVTSQVYGKDELHLTRPARTFTTNFIDPYSLYDVGPSGGRIFDIIGTGITAIYYEFAPNVLTEEEWSNITGTTVGTSTAFGSGTTNTDAIIAQSGHTNSSAQTCRFYGDERFMMKITTTSSNESVTIPHLLNLNYDYELDYGDLSTPGTVTSYNDSDCTHIYSVAGTYTVIIDGLCESIYVNNGPLDLVLDEIVNWGDTGFKTVNLNHCDRVIKLPSDINAGFSLVNSWSHSFRDMGLVSIKENLLEYATLTTSFNSIFAGNTDLESIPSSLFDPCTSVVSFAGVFDGCSSLESIPSELFDNNTLSSYFAAVFRNCTSLTTIPVDLFDNTSITNISNGFYGCSNITSFPSGLFDNTTSMLSFSDTFHNSGLTGITSGAFDNCPNVTNFYATFRGTDITSIPAGLFDNNPAVSTFAHTFNGVALTGITDNIFDFNTGVTTFDYTFAGSSITEIPSGLFDNNTLVESFVGTFYSADITSIPSGLFDNNTLVESFARTFWNNTSLTTIPDGLFDYNTGVTNFEITFNACTSLTTIPDGLFDYNTEVTNFNSTFHSSSLSGITSGLFDSCTGVTNFYGVFYSTDITSIPSGLFDNCTEVTEFRSAFSDTDITSIPSGLFDSCTKVTYFNSIFSSCTSLTGITSGLFDYNTEAELLGHMFYNTAVSSIPTDLFKYNTKAYYFVNTFYGSDITSIPSGLFDYNTGMTQVQYAFGYCQNLTAIPANIFDNNTLVTTFVGTFTNCTSLSGSTGNLWLNPSGASNYTLTGPNYDSGVPDGNDCYLNCTTLSGYTSIPTYWK